MQTTTGQKILCISAFLAAFLVTCVHTSVEAMSTQTAGMTAFRTAGAVLQPASAILPPPGNTRDRFLVRKEIPRQANLIG